jgi:hypothetical protein
MPEKDPYVDHELAPNPCTRPGARGREDENKSVPTTPYAALWRQLRKHESPALAGLS